MPLKTRADVDSATEGLLLSNISPKDKPWDRHRENSVEVARLYAECGYERYAKRMGKCSVWLGFRAVVDERDAFKLLLNSAEFCRVRHCPVCQWRRSLMWKARTYQMLPRLQEAYPKHRYIFLTLTVRNPPLTELRDTVQKMNKGWGRLAKRKAFPGEGWVKSIEVTRNFSDDTAHPHIHALLMVKPSYFTGASYLSKDKWIGLWKSCMRLDYDPSVNIQVVKPKDGVDDPVEGMKKAVAETIKYSVKEEDLIGKEKADATQMTNAEWLQELTKQLHKMRSVAIGGVFKEFMSEEEPEDLIGSDNEEEETSDKKSDVFFSWDEKPKRYLYKDK